MTSISFAVEENKSIYFSAHMYIQIYFNTLQLWRHFIFLLFSYGRIKKKKLALDFAKLQTQTLNRPHDPIFPPVSSSFLLFLCKFLVFWLWSTMTFFIDCIVVNIYLLYFIFLFLNFILDRYSNPDFCLHAWSCLFRGFFFCCSVGD